MPDTKAKVCEPKILKKKQLAFALYKPGRVTIPNNRAVCYVTSLEGKEIACQDSNEAERLGAGIEEFVEWCNEHKLSPIGLTVSEALFNVPVRYWESKNKAYRVYNSAFTRQDLPHEAWANYKDPDPQFATSLCANG
jgi:hypothetical protein